MERQRQRSRAKLSWELGVLLGVVSGCSQPETLVSDAASVAVTVQAVTGEGQQVEPQGEVPLPLVFSFRDEKGTPLRGVPVEFFLLETTDAGEVTAADLATAVEGGGHGLRRLKESGELELLTFEQPEARVGGFDTVSSVTDELGQASVRVKAPFVLEARLTVVARTGASPLLLGPASYAFSHIKVGNFSSPHRLVVRSDHDLGESASRPFGFRVAFENDGKVLSYLDGMSVGLQFSFEIPEGVEARLPAAELSCGFEAGWCVVPGGLFYVYADVEIPFEVRVASDPSVKPFSGVLRVTQPRPQSIGIATTVPDADTAPACVSPAQRDASCFQFNVDDGSLRLFSYFMDGEGRFISPAKVGWEISGPLADYAMVDERADTSHRVYPVRTGVGVIVVRNLLYGLVREYPYTVMAGAPASLRVEIGDGGRHLATEKIAAAVTLLDSRGNVAAMFEGKEPFRFELTGAQASPDPARVDPVAEASELLEFRRGFARSSALLLAPRAGDFPQVVATGLGFSAQSSPVKIVAGPPVSVAISTEPELRGEPLVGQIRQTPEQPLVMHVAGLDALSNYSAPVISDWTWSGFAAEDITLKTDVSRTFASLTGRASAAGQIQVTPEDSAVAGAVFDLAFGFGLPDSFELRTTHNLQETAGEPFRIMVVARDFRGTVATGYDAAAKQLQLSHTALVPSWAGRVGTLPSGLMTCQFVAGVCEIEGEYVTTNVDNLVAVTVLDPSGEIGPSNGQEANAYYIRTVPGPVSEVLLVDRLGGPQAGAQPYVAEEAFLATGEVLALATALIDKGGNFRGDGTSVSWEGRLGGFRSERIESAFRLTSGSAARLEYLADQPLAASEMARIEATLPGLGSRVGLGLQVRLGQPSKAQLQFTPHTTGIPQTPPRIVAGQCGVLKMRLSDSFGNIHTQLPSGHRMGFALGWPTLPQAAAQDRAATVTYVEQTAMGGWPKQELQELFPLSPVLKWSGELAPFTARFIPGFYQKARDKTSTATLELEAACTPEAQCVSGFADLGEIAAEAAYQGWSWISHGSLNLEDPDPEGWMAVGLPFCGSLADSGMKVVVRIPAMENAVPQAWGGGVESWTPKIDEIDLRVDRGTAHHIGLHVQDNFDPNRPSSGTLGPLLCHPEHLLGLSTWKRAGPEVFGQEENLGNGFGTASSHWCIGFSRSYGIRVGDLNDVQLFARFLDAGGNDVGPATGNWTLGGTLNPAPTIVEKNPGSDRIRFRVGSRHEGDLELSFAATGVTLRDAQVGTLLSWLPEKPSSYEVTQFGTRVATRQDVVFGLSFRDRYGNGYSRLLRAMEEAPAAVEDEMWCAADYVLKNVTLDLSFDPSPVPPAPSGQEAILVPDFPRTLPAASLCRMVNVAGQPMLTSNQSFGVFDPMLFPQANALVRANFKLTADGFPLSARDRSLEIVQNVKPDGTGNVFYGENVVWGSDVPWPEVDAGGAPLVHRLRADQVHQLQLLQADAFGNVVAMRDAVVTVGPGGSLAASGTGTDGGELTFLNGVVRLDPVDLGLNVIDIDFEGDGAIDRTYSVEIVEGDFDAIRLELARDPAGTELVSGSEVLNLEAGTTYYLRIQVVDADGNAKNINDSKYFQLSVLSWLANAEGRLWDGFQGGSVSLSGGRSAWLPWTPLAATSQSSVMVRLDLPSGDAIQGGMAVRVGAGSFDHYGVVVGDVGSPHRELAASGEFAVEVSWRDAVGNDLSTGPRDAVSLGVGDGNGNELGVPLEGGATTRSDWEAVRPGKLVFGGLKLRTSGRLAVVVTGDGSPHPSARYPAVEVVDVAPTLELISGFRLTFLDDPQALVAGPPGFRFELRGVDPHDRVVVLDAGLNAMLGDFGLSSEAPYDVVLALTSGLGAAPQWAIQPFVAGVARVTVVAQATARFEVGEFVVSQPQLVGRHGANRDHPVVVRPAAVSHYEVALTPPAGGEYVASLGHPFGATLSCVDLLGNRCGTPHDAMLEVVRAEADSKTVGVIGNMGPLEIGVSGPVSWPNLTYGVAHTVVLRVAGQSAPTYLAGTQDPVRIRFTSDISTVVSYDVSLPDQVAGEAVTLGVTARDAAGNVVSEQDAQLSALGFCLAGIELSPVEPLQAPTLPTAPGQFRFSAGVGTAPLTLRQARSYLSGEITVSDDGGVGDCAQAHGSGQTVKVVNTVAAGVDRVAVDPAAMPFIVAGESFALGLELQDAYHNQIKTQPTLELEFVWLGAGSAPRNGEIPVVPAPAAVSFDPTGRAEVSGFTLYRVEVAGSDVSLQVRDRVNGVGGDGDDRISLIRGFVVQPADLGSLHLANNGFAESFATVDLGPFVMASTDTVQLYAHGFDTYGNRISLVPATWSVSDGGGVLDAYFGLVASSPTPSLVVDPSLVTPEGDPAQISIRYGGFAATVAVSIVAGELDHYLVEFMASSDPVLHVLPGEAIDTRIRALDAEGNGVTLDHVEPITESSVTFLGAGTAPDGTGPVRPISGECVFVAGLCSLTESLRVYSAASDQVQVMFRDAAGRSGVSAQVVDVGFGILAAVEPVPSDGLWTRVAGEAIDFKFTALDAWRNVKTGISTLTLSFEWQGATPAEGASSGGVDQPPGPGLADGVSYPFEGGQFRSTTVTHLDSTQIFRLYNAFDQAPRLKVVASGTDPDLGLPVALETLSPQGFTVRPGATAQGIAVARVGSSTPVFTSDVSFSVDADVTLQAFAVDLYGNRVGELTGATWELVDAGGSTFSFVTRSVFPDSQLTIRGDEAGHGRGRIRVSSEGLVAFTSAVLTWVPGNVAQVQVDWTGAAADGQVRAGDANPLRVTLRDRSGMIKSDRTGTANVKFRWNQILAAPDGTVPVQNKVAGCSFSAGVCEYSDPNGWLKQYQAGTSQLLLTVFDQLSGKSGVALPLQVSEGDSTDFSVGLASGSEVVAGEAFAVTVTARDLWHNPVTTLGAGHTLTWRFSNLGSGAHTVPQPGVSGSASVSFDAQGKTTLAPGFVLYRADTTPTLHVDGLLTLSGELPGIAIAPSAVVDHVYVKCSVDGEDPCRTNLDVATTADQAVVVVAQGVDPWGNDNAVQNAVWSANGTLAGVVSGSGLALTLSGRAGWGQLQASVGALSDLSGTFYVAPGAFEFSGALAPGTAVAQLHEVAPTLRWSAAAGGSNVEYRVGVYARSDCSDPVEVGGTLPSGTLSWTPSPLVDGGYHVCVSAQAAGVAATVQRSRHVGIDTSQLWVTYGDRDLVAGTASQWAVKGFSSELSSGATSLRSGLGLTPVPWAMRAASARLSNGDRLVVLPLWDGFLGGYLAGQGSWSGGTWSASGASAGLGVGDSLVQLAAARRGERLAGVIAKQGGGFDLGFSSAAAFDVSAARYPVAVGDGEVVDFAFDAAAAGVGLYGYVAAGGRLYLGQYDFGTGTPSSVSDVLSELGGDLGAVCPDGVQLVDLAATAGGGLHVAVSCVDLSSGCMLAYAYHDGSSWTNRGQLVGSLGSVSDGCVARMGMESDAMRPRLQVHASGCASVVATHYSLDPVSGDEVWRPMYFAAGASCLAAGAAPAEAHDLGGVGRVLAADLDAEGHLYVLVRRGSGSLGVYTNNNASADVLLWSLLPVAGSSWGPATLLAD